MFDLILNVKLDCTETSLDLMVRVIGYIIVIEENRDIKYSLQIASCSDSFRDSVQTGLHSTSVGFIWKGRFQLIMYIGSGSQ